MSDQENDDTFQEEDDGEIAGPSNMSSRGRRSSAAEMTEYTNAQAIIDMLYIGFNGASSTGLSQDDMELSSKAKWLIIEPSYFPKDPEGRFYFKLSEWSDREHLRFSYGLISGVKKFIITTCDGTSFSAIMADTASIEHKEFKMFSAAINAMSVVHMLAIDLKASLGAAFPTGVIDEVDNEEVDRNYAESLRRHDTMYMEKARNIREAHEAWLSTKEISSTRVKNAIIRRREVGAEENYMEKLTADLISSHRSRSFATKNDLVNFVQNWGLDNCPIILEIAQLSKRALGTVTLAIKRRLKDDGEEEDEEEAYRRWAAQWIGALVAEQDDDQAFRAATRDIAFLSQIGVSFNFSSNSNLDDDKRRNEEERVSTVPERSTFRLVSESAYEQSLHDAFSKVPEDRRTIKYEGSILSEALSQSERATVDEVNKILPFLSNKNFGKIVRYMIVLTKLHWIRTNHHVGTEKEGIARSLSDALEHAMRAMPVEDPEITENDIRSFFQKHLHTIMHWASTHLVCGGLYMPSQKLICGFYHWVRHPRLVQKLTPEDDIRRRLAAAPMNLAKYYLVTAITSGSPL